MRKVKKMIIGGVTAILVLLAGCQEEEKAVADLVEPKIIEEVDQVDETVVDDYWSQPIDSEICQTIGECRDLGDTYGSDYFTDFSGTLKQRDNRAYLSVNTEEDGSALAFAANDMLNEDNSIARYEIIEDQFVLMKGEEESVFKSIADVVLALFNRDKGNLQILDFRENVYPNANPYDGRLMLPSNLLTHWLKSATISTLIHEYGHLLMWNKADFVNSDTCPEDQFHLKKYWECYNADSYMNLYYQAFLKDYEEKWLDAGIKTTEERIAFYEKNKDSFVSVYATVDPYEDIAESFSHFMLTPYNDSPQSISEEKVNFFYQFPELVEYRAFVLKELKDRKEDMGSFY